MYKNRTHSNLERLSIAVATVALTLATFGAFVFVPSDAAERNAIALNAAPSKATVEVRFVKYEPAAAPSHAIVDVKFVSYEPATRVN
jgi:hypothetical protein